jgi:4-hydroxy-tetrahydrodipicolinate synthase
MGRGLSADEIRTLVTEHPNIRLIKGEGPAVDIARLIEATQGRVPVFNGRGGLELPDNLRVGCAGLILAPDIIDYAVAVYERMRGGQEDRAEAMYAEILPAIVFVMQSIEFLICYGKRLCAARLGLEVQDRGPALRPTSVGLAMVERFARSLGPMEDRR